MTLLDVACPLVDLTPGKSQGAVAIDRSLVNEWFLALGGWEGINNSLMVGENVAQNAVACLGEDSLVVIVRLLADAHLPPKEHQPKVREWFTLGPGKSLFIQLQNNSSFGAQAVVEKIHALPSSTTAVVV